MPDLGLEPMNAQAKPFLILSCKKQQNESQGRIVYMPLDSSTRSPQGHDLLQVSALITAGLDDPRGVAFDRSSQRLFVADHGMKRLVSYNVQVNDGQLASDRMRTVLLDNVPVEWITLNSAGDLLYTSEEAIYKMPRDVVDRLVARDFDASLVQVKAESHPDEGQSVQPAVYTLFGADGKKQHLNKPGGIVADGSDLYWTNKADGKNGGAVVAARLQVGAANSSAGQTTPLSTNFASAHSVAKAGGKLFFTAKPDTGRDGRSIIGRDVASGVEVEMVTAGEAGTSVAKFHGMAWDGDGTIFLADEASGGVYSFPSGRLMNDAPLTLLAEVPGAFGVALATAGGGDEITDGSSETSSSQEQESQGTDTGVEATNKRALPAGAAMPHAHVGVGLLALWLLAQWA